MESVMRRSLQLSAFCLAAGIAVACKPADVIPTEDIPTAGIRFVNAVPDTFGVTLRPVDIVENSDFYNVNFRSTTLLFYKNARAGSRHYRIFFSPPDPNAPAEVQQAIASTVIKDTTVTLEAGHRYTFILWGFSRTGSSPGMRLDIMDDNPADPGAQVALRVINACLPGICGSSASGALDVREYARGTASGTACPGGGTVPAAATWAAVQPLSASSFVQEAVGQKCYNVQPPAGGTAVLTDALALAGVAATVDIDAIPGTTVAGSAVSGIIFPRSVAGSTAASFTTPGVVFVWDRRPPRPPGI
jgi:uncharacterized protein DUF4397